MKFACFSGVSSYSARLLVQSIPYLGKIGVGIQPELAPALYPVSFPLGNRLLLVEFALFNGGSKLFALLVRPKSVAGS